VKILGGAGALHSGMPRLRHPLLTLGALCVLGAPVAPAAATPADAPQACRALTRPQVNAVVQQHRAMATQRYRNAQALRSQRETRRELESESARVPSLSSGAAFADDASGAALGRSGSAMGRSTSAERPSTKSQRPSVRRPSARPTPRRPAPEPSAAARGDAPRDMKRARRAPKKDKAKGPESYSRTNTQELAVDEGDIVKTNGHRIYHVSCRGRGAQARCRDEIRVYSSWPPQRAGLISRYRIPRRGGYGAAASIRQLYLSGDDVVVLLEGTTNSAPSSRMLVLDMADPGAPLITQEAVVDGRFIESRRIGDDLYLATTTPAIRLPHALVQDLRSTLTQWPDEAYASGGPSTDEVIDALPAHWQTFLDQDPGLPRVRLSAGAARLSAPTPLYTCADLSNAKAGGQPLLNLAQLDLTGKARPTGAGVAGYTNQAKVYASGNAFYVAVAATPQSGWSQATEIQKFKLGADGPRYASSGRVRGHPLNQFSMSEFEGHLRIATSDGWRHNGLYVLADRGEHLQTIGRLEGFGRNERIFAVRMMGARGYVVTFRRTDPLYTLDLTRPEHPQLVGSLHVEGFSNYLHPLDDTHLLAIGQDADARGRATGFHMQIFDVEDPRNPRRIHHETFEGGSVSAAQTDHHAFMFEPSTNTLAIPWKGSNYWGLVAYKVDAKRGFSRLGRVNHAVMYKSWFAATCRRVDRAECADKNYWWRFFKRPDLDVDRIVAIDGHLYSLSPSGLMVHRVGRRLTRVRAGLVSVPQWPQGSAKRPEVIAAYRGP